MSLPANKKKEHFILKGWQYLENRERDGGRFAGEWQPKRTFRTKFIIFFIYMYLSKLCRATLMYK